MDDDTWEPENSLNCPELITEYLEKKKNKRTSGARATSKKLNYTEVEETDGENAKTIFVNGSSSKAKSKAKVAKGKKGSTKASTKGSAKASTKASKSQSKEEDDYEVEDIVGEKFERGKKYYFLKWKGNFWSFVANEKIVFTYYRLL